METMSQTLNISGNGRNLNMIALMRRSETSTAWRSRGLHKNLYDFNDTCCSGARDEVFALLSVSEDHAHLKHGIKADYALSAARLYQEVMATCPSDIVKLGVMLRDSLGLSAMAVSKGGGPPYGDVDAWYDPMIGAGTGETSDVGDRDEVTYKHPV